MAHDFAMRQCPPLGRLVQRFGGVRASPNNAYRVLGRSGQLLVYPGGDLDTYRHFRRRDEVVLGQRAGFVRVAQAAVVPLCPVVVHGAHRSALIFSEGEALARLIRLRRWGRLERFPLALLWGLAVGPWLPYLPLPFPVRLRVLPPLQVPARADPGEVHEEVRGPMQVALDEMARAPRAWRCCAPPRRPRPAMPRRSPINSASASRTCSACPWAAWWLRRSSSRGRHGSPPGPRLHGGLGA